MAQFLDVRPHQLGMQPTTINFTSPESATHDILTLVALITIGVTLLVHLIVATAVINDSVVIQRRDGRLMFFGPLTWGFLGLMTGLLGLLAYWLMHHSSFRVSPSSTDAAKADKDYEKPVA